MKFHQGFVSSLLIGVYVNVGALPFVPWVVSEVNPQSEYPRNMYYNYCGSDISILQAICQVQYDVVGAETFI